MNTILIIDDEKQICESIQLILDFEGYHTDFATSGIEGLQKISSEQFDVVLLDIQMPDLNGFEVLTKAKQDFPFLNVIIISAFGNIQNAIQATRLGAFDFLEKPIDRDKLLITIRNAVEQAHLKKENDEMKKTFLEPGEIIGSSRALNNVLSLIEKVSETDVRVLITGENGTGKELVARAIYKKSLRKEKPFIEVNCAAIPNELIESELFGHEKGSFTGAMQQRIGKFELANKGTIFLDEIGDMSLQAQAKVLRAIEDGIIQRVGGTKSIEVDARILSATNKNLTEEIEKGNFREDLLHRLNVIPILVPPLRERPEDIPLLVKHFAQDISQKHKKVMPTFSEEALTLLQSFRWAGNIRELRNIVERIIILIDKKEISKKDVEFLVPYEKQDIGEMVDLSNSFQDFKGKAERAFIMKQLDANHWNISKTADSLNIQRSHLYNKMKKYDIVKGKT
ncbi:MAG: Fis family transcriptional regulator [Ignavibacteria bacterium CG22_combo_CG10-13_8_21_14_all_37_15]|nr:MAG: Fis family transcriptional regulator [Ignavibacteria bacterium CG22_combo_CG10-13_8_21_14_all_37_15]